MRKRLVLGVSAILLLAPLAVLAAPRGTRTQAGTISFSKDVRFIGDPRSCFVVTAAGTVGYVRKHDWLESSVVAHVVKARYRLRMFKRDCKTPTEDAIVYYDVGVAPAGCVADSMTCKPGDLKGIPRKLRTPSTSSTVATANADVAFGSHDYLHAAPKACASVFIEVQAGYGLIAPGSLPNPPFNLPVGEPLYSSVMASFGRGPVVCV